MKIFISYRRDDTAGFVGRLYDGLREHFAAASLFMDVDHIAPGADFVDVLDGAVAQCDVMLVVIGRYWTAPVSPAGAPRLMDSADFVRIEVASALKRRSEITLIPVLVDGARPLSAADLPEVLAPLARLQAVVLRHESWRGDVDRLVQHLKSLERRLEEDAAAVVPPAPPLPTPPPPIVPPKLREDPVPPTPIPDPIDDTRVPTPVPDPLDEKDSHRARNLALGVAAAVVIGLAIRAATRPPAASPPDSTRVSAAAQHPPLDSSTIRRLAADSAFDALRRRVADKNPASTPNALDRSSLELPASMTVAPSDLNELRTRALTAARAQWHGDARIVRVIITWGQPRSTPRVVWLALSQSAGASVTIDLAADGKFWTTEEPARSSLAELPALPDRFVELSAILVRAHALRPSALVDSAELDARGGRGPIWSVFDSGPLGGSTMFNAITGVFIPR